MNRLFLTVAILAGCCATHALAAEPAPLYTVTSTITLGAPERWDYLAFDPATQRVYIAHGSGVSVVDLASASVIGVVDGLSGGTHGVAIPPGATTGYTDDGKAGVAVPFDLATLKTGTPIPTAEDADGIVFDPASGHLMVINGDSGSVTVVDPATNAALATIDAGAGLEIGVADGKGKFYVDGADRKEIVRIDTATNAIDARWPLAGCESPHGLAMDRDTRRLFATCINKVMVVVDADTSGVLATLPIGAYSDGAAFDPVRKRAFSSNGEGSLSIIEEVDANTFVALPPLPTAPSARTMTIDPSTGRLFLAVGDIEKVDPPSKPGGRPHVTYVAGSLKLLVLTPVS